MGHASSAAALRYQHATRERDVEIARRLDEFVAQRDSTSEQSSARWTRDGVASTPLGAHLRPVGNTSDQAELGGDDGVVSQDIPDRCRET